MPRWRSPLAAQQAGTTDRILAPIIGSVLGIEWGAEPDQLVRRWPTAEVVRRAEDVQTLIVSQVPLACGVAVTAECTFTWEGLVSVALRSDGGDAEDFDALCAEVLEEVSTEPRGSDVGYLTCAQEGTRLSVDLLDRVVRLEEAGP